ncbi:16S rRNA (guanine(527)-N(7))-methyltransferase RsmG [SAR86 cluster bacterium]|jgi:16S rRNA (guanine527-N7)-methyltransferase|nr:16S rRNA (guanine(527)-N(7))-methyltransferase RsmG [SAR86 cluster bacterium]
MLIKKILASSSQEIDKIVEANLEKYLETLCKWNKTRNLVSRNLSKVELAEHIFDCICLMPFLDNKSIIDIGTGAGLPGIIVSIMDENKEVVLVEPNQKKISFLLHIQAEMGLKNLVIKKERFENALLNSEGVLVARAFTEPNKFIEILEQKNIKNSEIIMMVSEEIKIISPNWRAVYTTSEAEKVLEKKRGFLNISRIEN